jgi:GLPGLI family protein
MKNSIILLIALLTGNILFAQSSKSISTGTVEYDKTVNMYALARNILSSNANSSFSSIFTQGFEQYQKNHPQFATVKSTLAFNADKTLFTPNETGDNIVAYMGTNLVIRQFNTIYTDLAVNKRVMQKEILDKQFLVTDSTSKIKWRITGGSQDIAGYTCREAHGLIQDSIYVVAFYTDKIWVSGGPESFSGLPGMILKVVIPHEHITWTATKVTTNLPLTAIEPPKKGKLMTSKELVAMLKKASQGYNLKIFML